MSFMIGIVIYIFISMILIVLADGISLPIKKWEKDDEKTTWFHVRRWIAVPLVVCVYLITKIYPQKGETK